MSTTIVASATAPGESALAVVRCSGALCRTIAESLLGGRLLVPRVATLVSLRSGLDGALLDRGLLTFFEGPASFTGEDSLEISLHGNPFIVVRVIEELRRAGCVTAQPGEFTRRAFLNGKLDLSQAEAVSDLIRARSEAALALAHRQLAGELGSRVRALVGEVVRVAAELEAYLDFPEEDLPQQNREALLTAMGRVRREAASLASTRRFGAWVRDGIRVVLVGAPNAGKSSLLNRLVGTERALVDPTPGTTRDFIEAEVMVAGFRVLLVDTAGLRDAGEAVEKAGVRRSLEQARGADLLWYVVDAAAQTGDQGPGTEPWTPFEGELDRTAEKWLVWNKMDAVVRPSALAGDRGGIAVSALTGEGIPTLFSELEQWIRRTGAADRSEGLAVNARHAEALESVVVSLSDAVGRLEAGGPPDVLLASDVRAALDGLGLIVGRIDHEEVLDVLFSAFCIGK